MNWFAAQTLFSSARDKTKGKPLKANTRLYEDDNGDFYIVFHSTRIITIHRDGTYTLNTRGGDGWQYRSYRTVTTKQRLNQFAPVYIYQRDFTWYLNDDVMFHDNMRVNDVGMVMDE